MKKGNNKNTSPQYQRLVGSLLLIVIIIILSIILYRYFFAGSKEEGGIVISAKPTQTKSPPPKYSFYEDLKKGRNDAEGVPIILESAKGVVAQETAVPTEVKIQQPEPIQKVIEKQNQVNETLANTQKPTVQPNETNLAPNPVPNTSPQTSGAYRIQIGAFKDPNSANRLRAKMILDNYPVHIVNANGVHLVQIGPYKDKTAAQKIEKQLKQKGINTFIKSN